MPCAQKYIELKLRYHAQRIAQRPLKETLTLLGRSGHAEPCSQKLQNLYRFNLLALAPGLPDSLVDASFEALFAAPDF